VLIRLNFYHLYKTPSSAFSKKISATTPFLHGFGRALSGLQLCFFPTPVYLTPPLKGSGFPLELCIDEIVFRGLKKLE